jgi:hypothetical protein
VLYQLIHITAKLEQLPVYPEDSHHARTLETESWSGPTVMAGPKIHLDKMHDTYISTPSQVSTETKEPSQLPQPTVLTRL